MAGIACPYTVIRIACRMALAAGRVSPVGNMAIKTGSIVTYRVQHMTCEDGAARQQPFGIDGMGGTARATWMTALAIKTVRKATG